MRRRSRPLRGCLRDSLQNVVVVDGLKLQTPRTKDFVGILSNLKIDRSCLVTTSLEDVNLVKSADNIPKVAVLPVSQLNAGDICNYRKMLFTKEAFLSVLDKDQAKENDGY